MKPWLAKLFGKQQSDTVFPAPWETHQQSIYRFLSPYAAGNAPLPENTQTLPDENTQEDGIRWVAGGMDGAFGHHGCGNNAEDTAQQLLAAFTAVTKRPTQQNMQALYALLKEAAALDYIDILIEKLAHAKTIPAQKLHDLVVWLAMESPDRNPVKCAIALLAWFPSRESEELVTTLGLHEEFTLFSAVALCNMLPDESREPALLALAKRVTGWGRIQLIERFPSEVSPDTQDWLLREGYSNSVMTEYTAWDCATKGKLLAVLTGENIDTQRLSGAGEILAALINGGPARGISSYADGAQACYQYLRLVSLTADDDVNNLLNAGVIAEFVRDEDRDWTSLEVKGWSNDIRLKIDEAAQTILAQPKWRTKVEKGLTAKEQTEFNLAVYAAKLLGIETWDVIFARQSAYAQESNWYELMKTDCPQRLEQILTLAESQLSLATIATGPDTQMGPGPRYVQHSALNFILQDLKRFPGMGWTLIKTGLRSPVIRSRHMALNAIESWAPEQRPAELQGLLETALQQEPDERVRERLQEVLTGNKV